MYVRVEVRPGARKESVIALDEKTYSVSVREPAKQGLANARVRELIARELSVPLMTLRLISGHRSPRKIFSVSS